MEEQAFGTHELDVRQCLGETRRLVPGDPGARVLPTCFLTPILLPVNPAALQPEWPDRTLWVSLPSCLVLHRAGSPALHSCSLPVAASYSQAQSWAVSKRIRNVLRGAVATTLESSKVGSVREGECSSCWGTLVGSSVAGSQTHCGIASH